MIQIEGLQFGYSDHKILSIPQLEVKDDEHLMILGKSGSGKTTMLHILGGLLAPTEGKVVIGQANIYHLSSVQRDQFRGQNIGLIFQKPHLISALSVEDNLLLAQYLSGATQDKARVREVLEELDLLPKRKKKVKALSQGEQQRVTVARALINRPRVILADEPTASLDDDNALRVISLLKEKAAAYQAALVIATHDQRVKKEFDVQLNLTST
jgi:putative ABC transport system ATP-binding protein